MGARHSLPSTAEIVGFPLHALRDPELSVADLRMLVCIGALAGSGGACESDLGAIARHTDLPEAVVRDRLQYLTRRGYVCRTARGRSEALGLAAAMPAGEPAEAARRPSASPARPAQARLHSDLLRRRTRRPAGSIEFDDPTHPHPVVTSLQQAMQGDSGRTGGFRFWLQTILDPEDVAVFSDWANRQSDAYRTLIRQFEHADDDQAIESLLDQTLALVDREKSAER